MFYIPVIADAAAETTAAAETGGSIISLLLPFIILFGLMYLMIFLPQKRREKKTKGMLAALQVGEEVVTIGGIRGRVVNIKDDEVTIESGIDKTRLTLNRGAIGEVKKPIEA